MVDTTTHYDLVKPTVGKTTTNGKPWGQVLGEDLDELDQLIYDIIDGELGNGLTVLDLGTVSSTPTDSDIGSGNVALYFKTDNTLYKRPYGGTESAVNTDTQPVASGTSATASGDGTTVTFSLSHSLGVTPSQASVQPTSADADGEFYVSAKTSTAVDVTYATAPASGTSNLTYDLVLIE